MKLPKSFTKVTPFSKRVALVLFIALPLVTFYIGVWVGLGMMPHF